ncbi:MAG: ACT domain-containing protein [Firmicutes bacterium]|nr:ACT domain-containing protein [Bacillota bacterium]
MKAIITVIGKDRRGIIAGVSNVLANSDANILDISQTIMQEYFTMMMLVDLSHMNVSLAEIKELLDRKGEELGVSIKAQHEDIFRSMHRI